MKGDPLGNSLLPEKVRIVNQKDGHIIVSCMKESQRSVKPKMQIV